MKSFFAERADLHETRRIPLSFTPVRPGTDAAAEISARWFGNADGWLRRLRREGVTHIELRTLRSGITDKDTAAAVSAVRAAGLSLTVHGALEDEPAAAFWGRLAPVLDTQPALTVTIHSAATREETIALLRRIAEYAAAHHPDARLALENNRSKKGDHIALVECDGVWETIRAAGLPNVGTCWDFGHFYWDRLAHPQLIPDDLPPQGFIDRAIHTHIHSVFSDTTHFPLTMGALPLSEYIASLAQAGYRGVYNLEPEPERWPDSSNCAEEILRSVQILRNTLASLTGE